MHLSRAKDHPWSNLADQEPGQGGVSVCHACGIPVLSAHWQQSLFALFTFVAFERLRSRTIWKASTTDCYKHNYAHQGFFLTQTNLWIKACTFNRHRCASFRLTWRLNWLTSRIHTMWFGVGYAGISKTTRTDMSGVGPAIWQFHVSQKRSSLLPPCHHWISVLRQSTCWTLRQGQIDWHKYGLFEPTWMGRVFFVWKEMGTVELWAVFMLLLLASVVSERAGDLDSTWIRCNLQRTFHQSWVNYISSNLN